MPAFTLGPILVLSNRPRDRSSWLVIPIVQTSHSAMCGIGVVPSGSRPQQHPGPIGLLMSCYRQHITSIRFLLGCGRAQSNHATGFPCPASAGGGCHEQLAFQHHPTSSTSRTRPHTPQRNICASPWLLIFWDLRPGRMRAPPFRPSRGRRGAGADTRRNSSGMQFRPFLPAASYINLGSRPVGGVLI